MLDNLVGEYSTLVGVAAFFALVINVLKHFGLVQDGDAPTWATGLNLIGLVILYALKVYAFEHLGEEFDLETLDNFAQAFADAGRVLFQFILMLGGSKLTHKLVKGAPGIGFSYGGGQ